MGKILQRKEKVALAVSIGEELLKNGGEVYRVEDTLKRILLFYGFTDLNVYIISNDIFVTVDENGEEPLSCVRNVPSWNLNLGKIAELNKLSREICEGRCSIDKAREQLNIIINEKQRTDLVQGIATGIGSAAFCYLLGGRMTDMIFSVIIGFILKIFLNMSERRNVSKFITRILGSILVSILAVLFYQLFSGILVDKVIIGSILILVPGVALTTSIRDFFGGDYLSGSIHLIDALLTAVCIAAGVGVAMKAFMILGWI